MSWRVYRFITGHAVRNVFDNYVSAVEVARMLARQTGYTYCVRRVQP